MLRSATLFVLLAASASGQTYSGQLAEGDGRLNSGEFSDEYTLTAERGEVVRAVVTSQAFDTYVILKTAAGQQAEDDDCTGGETSRSCAQLVVEEAGEVRVLVTSFQPGETGAYRVEIAVAPSAGAFAQPLTAVAAALADGDGQLQTGELYDEVVLLLDAGDRRRIEMRSDAFDPYLIATGPGDARVENDDCADGATDACVVLVASEPGEWRIVATSRRSGERGAYTLDLDAADAP